MSRPSSRALAYIFLWLLLAGLIAWRRQTEAPSSIERSVDSFPAFAIDLNRDPWERLTLIDGIGETLARRIVEEREKRGGFDSIEEVMDVRGVPDRSIDEARPWLTLGPRSAAPATGPRREEEKTR